MSNENKEWHPGMNMGFQVGDPVYYGGVEGKINSITGMGDYPIIFEYGNRDLYAFTKDGRFEIDHKAPSLFFKPQTYDISRPAWEPKPGEWCWFWNTPDYGFLCKFLQMYKDKYVDVSSDRWEHCAPFKGELPDHLKQK